MPIIEMQDDVELIQKLGDNPNTDNELSAQQLKELFDKAPSLIKSFINGTLVPEVNRLGSDSYIEKVANEAVRGLVEQDIPITIDLEGAEPISPNVDVDRLTKPGRYACETGETAKTLLGCPVDGPFTMDVRYANGKGPHVGQELKPAGKGARLYRQFVEYPDILSEEAKTLYDRVRKVRPENYGDTNGEVDIYSGGEDISWYNESDSTFYLDSADKLYGLAALVNSGKTFSGKTVILTKDMVINEGVASEWNAETIGLYSWTPIGAAVDSINSWKFINHFNGTLDGQGHYISGLYNVQGRDNGFMCYTVNATIKNLAIINSYFENEGAYMSAAKPNDAQVLGAFVGRGYGITLKNLYTNAILVCTGKDYHTGGIAGFAKSNGSVSDKKSPAVTHNFGPATIDSVVFEGSIQTTVSAGSLVGGILGGTDSSYVAIVNSLFAGAIKTNDSPAGGIVGRISEYSTVDGCVAVGSINKKTNTGGIVGQLYLNKATAGLFTITDCHYDLEIDLEVYGSTYNNSGGIIQVNDSNSKKLSAECMEHSMVPTKWAKVYDSENKIPFGDIGAMATEVLWVNANPGGYFGAQTLQLDLSAYDFVAVVAAETSSSSPTYMPMVVAPCAVGSYGTISGYSFQLSGEVDIWMAHRSFGINANGISFSTGNQYAVRRNAMYQGENQKAVPMFILGIKGVVK